MKCNVRFFFTIMNNKLYTCNKNNYVHLLIVCVNHIYLIE